MTMKRHRGYWALTIAAAALAHGPAVSAQESKRPTVKVITPSDVEPLVRADSKAMQNGQASHRRVVSLPKDGSTRIDVGYNSYKAGYGADAAYAYDKDELCYIPSGEIEAESDGVTVIAKPGSFMWRPAGAPTHRTRVLKDAVTICAFGPARADSWSHRLPPEKIGQWNGEEADRPRVRFYDYRYIKPLIRPGSAEHQDGRIIHRRVVSGPKDGAIYIDASHNIYKAGLTSGPYVYPDNDEVCWIESGAIEMVNQGVKTIVRAGQFAYRPAGAATDSTRVLEDAVSICFFTPARKDDWSFRSVP